MRVSIWLKFGARIGGLKENTGIKFGSLCDIGWNPLTFNTQNQLHDFYQGWVKLHILHVVVSYWIDF